MFAFICVRPYVCSAMSALMCSHMSPLLCYHLCVVIIIIIIIIITTTSVVSFCPPHSLGSLAGIISFQIYGIEWNRYPN